MRKTFDSREAEVTQVCPVLYPYVDTFSPNAKETGVPGEEDLTTLGGVLKAGGEAAAGDTGPPVRTGRAVTRPDSRWPVGAEE